MLSDAEVAGLLARNELLDLLIEPDQRLIYAAQVLAVTRDRAEAVAVLVDRFEVSEKSIDGFLAATVEMLTSGYMQTQLQSELAANRLRLAALRRPTSLPTPPAPAEPTSTTLW